MIPAPNGTLLKITKYPNRRYYDVTRSVHVNLDDIYSLVLDGYDVEITDSKSQDDLTNLILTQIILDRDPPKLDLIPSAILHQMLRSNRRVLRAFVDRYFGQLMGSYVAFQKQIEQMVREGTPRTPMFNPAMDWAQSMMQFFNPAPTSHVNGAPAEESHKSEPPPETHGNVSMDELRAEIDELKVELRRLHKTKRTGKERRKR